MKFKKLVVLMVVLAVLLGIGIFKKACFKKNQGVNPAVLQNESLIGQNFSSGFVAKIDMRRGTGNNDLLVFAKNKSGQWILENRYGTRVRKENVDPLLKQLSDLRGEVRAEDKHVFDDFSLTDEKAVHIRLYGSGGNELTHVLVSPLRPRGQQNFVSISNTARIFATDTDVLATLGIFSNTDKLNYHTFADLRVAGIDSSKVNSFELTAPGAITLPFVKKENAKDQAVSWSLSDDSSAVVDTGKVNEFLSSIHNLYAQESLDPAAHVKDFSAATPWLRVHIKSEEKLEPVEIWVATSSEEKKTALVKVMPETLVYELPDSQISLLLKKNKQFFLNDSTQAQAQAAPAKTVPAEIVPVKIAPPVKTTPVAPQHNTFVAKRKKS